MCSTLRSSYWLDEELKYLGQRQGGETWNGHRMAHAHIVWYGNSEQDISVPSTEISTRVKYRLRVRAQFSCHSTFFGNANKYYACPSRSWICLVWCSHCGKPYSLQCNSGSCYTAGWSKINKWLFSDFFYFMEVLMKAVIIHDPTSF